MRLTIPQTRFPRLLALGALLLLTSPANGQNLLHFDVSGSSQPGGIVDVGLLLDHDVSLRAWQISVCHSGLERVNDGFGTGVAFQATFVDPDFFYQEATADPEAFAAAGVFSAPLYYLPPVGSRELHFMQFTSDTTGIFGLALCVNSIEGMTWLNQIGGPVTPGQPVFFEPDLQSAIIGFYGPFLRGDCQIDGILGLTDVLSLLSRLFLGAPAGSCLESCDNDADGELNLTDALILLNYLYLAGPPPAAPTSCDFPTTFFFGCVQGCP